MPRRMRQTSFLSAISSLPTCGHPPLQQASEKRYYSLKVIQGMVDEWGGRRGRKVIDLLLACSEAARAAARIHHPSLRRVAAWPLLRARAAARARAANRCADGVCREGLGRTGSSPHSGRDSRSSGGRRAATSGSTLAGRQPMTRSHDSDSRRNSSRCSPTSFFRQPHPPPRRCCNKRAPSPSFS